MQLVMSQAWTRDDAEAAQGYIAASAEMNAWLAQQDGFLRRELVRGIEDPTHFINLRWFVSIDHYLAITKLPEYPGLLESLAVHLDLEKYEQTGYPREFLDVVLTSDEVT